MFVVVMMGLLRSVCLSGPESYREAGALLAMTTFFGFWRHHLILLILLSSSFIKYSLMITAKNFIFNPFRVNTYLLFDETKECIIIDPACMEEYEEKHLSEFIETQKLRPVRLFNTHAHIDHIAGNKFVAEKYKIGLDVHKKSLSFIRSAKEHASAFGFDDLETIEPSAFIDDGDTIKFGHSELKVLYTPGHADGSISFYAEKEKFVIVGDVLFNGSIGRTDLPTGNYNILIEGIKNKLLVLPESTLVYPGHGSFTTIKHEKYYNPFLTGC